MATIEERAKDFADRGLPNNIEGAIRYTYIYAANEQQKLDIEKACEWLKENVEKYLYNRGGFEEYIPTCGSKLFTDFEKAMEE